MLDNIDLRQEADRFLDLFKELEQLIKSECQRFDISTENGESINILIKKLSEKSILIKRYKNDLDLIRKIRNTNSHQKDDKYNYVVCPSPDISEKLEKIINELKKPLISESKIMVKWNDVYKRKITDNVFETIKTMSEKVYTFVPILENNKFIGVFSENILLDVINKEEGIILDEKTNFSEFKEYLNVDNHSMEKFEFVARNTNIYDVQELFNNYFSSDKVLGCVFVTEHGEKDDNILGMFTAWDVLGN